MNWPYNKSLKPKYYTDGKIPAIYNWPGKSKKQNKVESLTLLYETGTLIIS